MEQIGLKTLLSFSRELNIFESRTVVYEELLRDGLYPPLPVSGSRLVWGFPLLFHAEKCGILSLMCRKFDLSPADQIKTALRLERRTNDYSLREKIDLWKLIVLFQCEAHGEEIIPLVQSEGDFAEQVKRILLLPLPLQGLVRDGLVDVKTATTVQKLPEELFRLIREHQNRLSFSERRLVLVRIWEMSCRDKANKESTIALFREIIESDSPLDRSAECRFPELSAMNRQFDAFKNDVLGKTGVRLSPPRFFEGESFELGFRFANKKQLEERIKALNVLKDRCDELFRLLY